MSPLHLVWRFTPLITLHRFAKSYGSHVAVHGIDLHVDAGEILGLVGSNGAGKTSTLRSIAGILSISGGRIEVGGADLQRQSVQAKQITAYVPDDPELFHDLTVEQHLRFIASVYGIKSPGDEMTRLLNRFELESKRHTAASELSRGMRQKLAICCALLQQPKVVLLDEPMTGLDPLGIRRLKESVVAAAGQGVTFIISSHLLAMVEDICSSIAILDRGRIKFHGTLDELRMRPSPGDLNSNPDASPSSPRSLEDIYFETVNGDQDRDPNPVSTTANEEPIDTTTSR